MYVRERINNPEEQATTKGVLFTLNKQHGV